ncbi:MAG: hypothetical protein WBD20_12340 [Pirellulaceae bacterium]
MPQYFVRLGSLGQIFPAQAAGSYPCGRRVIVRTRRGAELAEVVKERKPAAAKYTETESEKEGTKIKIVRGTTSEDELLIERLERYKSEAVQSCRIALAESGSTSTLLDVDQIFDGGILVMHYLGPVDEIAQTITDSVAKEYESIVRTAELGKLLSEGCGPDCGTAQGGGCGGSCSGCAVAAACQTS